VTLPCFEQTVCVAFSHSVFRCSCSTLQQYSNCTNYSSLLQSKRGSGMNVTEEQLFEHERFMPLAGWSSRHLLPTERNRYSRQEDGMHSTNNFPQIRLPEGIVGSC